MTKARESMKLINEIGSNGYETLRQLSDITLNAWNQAVEQQLEAYSSLMDSGLEQIKRISDAKDYREIVRGQLELSHKLGEAMMRKTRETVALNQKTGTEIRAWFESGLASAGEQFAKAAEKAA